MKLITIFGFILLSYTNPPIQSYFGENFTDAITYVLKTKKLTDSVCKSLELNPEVVISIVFPELNRYSMIQDFIETQSLETIYVLSGTDVIDFSIGQFQMKVSFIEKVEKYIETDLALKTKYAKLLPYPTRTSKQNRQERMNRLKSEKWQLIYVCAFTDIVLQRFSELKKCSPETQIEFLATAYNFDFMASKDDISATIPKKSFPYGINNKSPYAYCEVSIYFYQNFIKTKKNRNFSEK